MRTPEGLTAIDEETFQIKGDPGVLYTTCLLYNPITDREDNYYLLTVQYLSTTNEWIGYYKREW